MYLTTCDQPEVVGEGAELETLSEDARPGSRPGRGISVRRRRRRDIEAAMWRNNEADQKVDMT